jgi:lysozyme
MTPSPACIALIKQFEGCRLTAYKDPVGVLTIGFGHTGREVTEDLIWTQQQADAQLVVDAQLACNQMSEVVKVDLSQNETDALTDFTFNEGIGHLSGSSLLRALNAGRKQQVPQELEKWIYAGGEVLPGLVNRRAAEARMWMGENQ